MGRPLDEGGVLDRHCMVPAVQRQYHGIGARIHYYMQYSMHNVCYDNIIMITVRGYQVLARLEPSRAVDRAPPILLAVCAPAVHFLAGLWVKCMGRWGPGAAVRPRVPVWGMGCRTGRRHPRGGPGSWRSRVTPWSSALHSARTLKHTAPGHRNGD